MTGFSKAFYKTLFLAFLFSMTAFVSCKTASPARPASSGGAPGEKNESGQPGLQPGLQPANPPQGSVSEEIRRLIESGRLSSMLRASELIQERNLAGAEFGRVMNGIIFFITRQVYPDSVMQVPPPDLPQTNNYARILREAEKGNYVRPPDNSSDFFERALPFLSVNDNTPPGALLMIMEDLEKARGMRPLSVLPFYFRGAVFERLNLFDDAAASFASAYEISDECYPALVGVARAAELSGRSGEAAALLAGLAARYPGNMRIKKLLALSLYENGDWARAGQAADEILQKEPRDGEFLLMKADILIKDGQYAKALSPLETYSFLNPNNRLYLLLRAKAQYEGYRNRDSALKYLRAIISGDPDDEEALIFAASLLMESRKEAELAEGMEFLSRLQRISGSSAAALALSLQDAVLKESWREAKSFLTSLPAVRRDAQVLQNAYLVERGLGNNAAALAYAKELYGKDSSNNEYAAVYVSALIDNGMKEEASRMIENLLPASAGGADKSRFYYLRGRLRENDEAASGDFFSSLFEDPRNLDALIAMFEMCRGRKEARRAAYYLKQAISIAPSNPRLRRYETEYAALLNGR
jgi:tetratricopeptide (TPR) repeat protein